MFIVTASDHSCHRCVQQFLLVEKLKMRKYWVEAKNSVSRSIGVNQHESFFQEENLKKIWKWGNYKKLWRISTSSFLVLFTFGNRWSLDMDSEVWVVGGEMAVWFLDEDTMAAFGDSFYLFIRYSYWNSWKWMVGQDMAVIWFMPIWSFVVNTQN